MKILDLRSDTVTQPTEEMRQAIYKAKVGDDGYGEDPTVNHLEELSAQLSGKEAALFVPSGTMGNLISLLTHCQRGDEAITGDASHIALMEQVGACALGGISLRTVPNLPNGQLSLSSIDNAINPDSVYFARTKLICIENTWHGHPLPQSYTEDLYKLAQANNLKLHLDGSRIFNASVALKASIAELTKNMDSVQMSFSKGLCAPAGSVVCASKIFIDEARRNRKVLGGSMRQVGILAAACIVGLERNVNRLEKDHQNAQILADEFSQFPELEILPAEIRTNIIFFRVILPGVTNLQFIEKLKEKGVLMGLNRTHPVRAVTHNGISVDDTYETVKRVRALLQELKVNAKRDSKVLRD